jgi:REP element-mobilizing transposase RayT
MSQALSPDECPLGFLITFRCYGTWLHGDERGSVDREHNMIGTPFVDKNDRRQEFEREVMSHPPYQLDELRRETMLTAIREVCEYRKWMLFAAHVREDHVHVVVQAGVKPEKVLNDFKTYSTRALKKLCNEPPGCVRWSRHGSTRWLWKQTAVEDSIRYTLDEQGKRLTYYDQSEDPNR